MLWQRIRHADARLAVLEGFAATIEDAVTSSGSRLAYLTFAVDAVSEALDRDLQQQQSSSAWHAARSVASTTSNTNT